MDVAAVNQEIVQDANASRPAAPDSGHRWTSRQLLFHLRSGYLLVRTLLPLVRGFGRLPLVYSRRFYPVLHAVRRPSIAVVEVSQSVRSRPREQAR
jgi:hypothetical protein